MRAKEKLKIKNEDANVRLRNRRSAKETSIGFADDEEPQGLHIEIAEKVPLPLAGDEDNPRQAISVLRHVISRIRDLRTPKGVGWVPKASELHMVPKPDGLFPVLAVTAFVLSTGVCLPINHQERGLLGRDFTDDTLRLPGLLCIWVKTGKACTVFDMFDEGWPKMFVEGEEVVARSVEAANGRISEYGARRKNLNGWREEQA
ncbi:MAG: hypothetical protein Q9163_002909 [Psora crenata]